VSVVSGESVVGSSRFTRFGIMPSMGTIALFGKPVW
jgi:hypothetical protein